MLLQHPEGERPLVDDPFEAIHQFFELMSLPEAKAMLWSLLKETLTGPAAGLTPTEQYQLLSFYERLAKVLDVTHTLNQENKALKTINNAAASGALLLENVLEKGGPQLAQLIQGISVVTGAECLFFHSIYQDSPAPRTLGYHLLAVVPDQSPLGSKGYQQFLQVNGGERTVVTTTLLKAGVLQQTLEQGHLFYSQVCTPENLLFDRSHISIPVIPQIPIPGILARAEEKFFSPYEKATGFLEGARHYYQQNENELCAFLLHQATEQSYRSLLQVLTGFAPMTHDLEVLRHYCRCFTPLLEEAFSNATEKDQTWFTRLQNAYVQARYSERFEVADDVLQGLLRSVAALIETVKTIFEETAQAFAQHFAPPP